MSLQYQRAFAHQSWHRDSIRQLVIALVDENPNTTDEHLIQMAIQRMREDEEWLMAAGEYAVMQTLNTMHARHRSSPVSSQQRAQASAERQTIVENIKQQIMLLNLEMPNGKRMRWCTGAEMEKFGGAFSRIGKKVGKSKTVGQVLSEEQVKSLMR